MGSRITREKNIRCSHRFSFINIRVSVAEIYVQFLSFIHKCLQQIIRCSKVVPRKGEQNYFFVSLDRSDEIPVFFYIFNVLRKFAQFCERGDRSLVVIAYACLGAPWPFILNLSRVRWPPTANDNRKEGLYSHKHSYIGTYIHTYVYVFTYFTTHKYTARIREFCSLIFSTSISQSLQLFVVCRFVNGLFNFR